MATSSDPEVRRIVDARGPWCVTVYGDAHAWLRGNHPTEAARAQIRAALDSLTDAGAPARIADAVSDQLEQVTTASEARPPIDHRVRGVGVFATPDRCELIPLLTIPTPWVGVGDRFLVAPLVEGVLALQPPVFVLAASENRVRLIDASAHPARVLDVPGLPLSLHAAIRLDLTGNRNTLAHLRVSEDPKQRLHEYARAIQHAVEPVRGKEAAVILLAAAEPLSSILRAASPNPESIAGVLAGNHDDDTADVLANLADERLRRQRDLSHVERLDRLVAENPHLVVRDLAAIEEAAAEGRIDTLFVDTDWRAPAIAGRGTPDRGDELVRRALADDASIIPVHSDPSSAIAPATAILRYPPTR